MKVSVSFKNAIVNIICLLYILLFVYAAVSKFLDFQNFRVQLAQSPLLSAYAQSIAPLVLATELFSVLLLSYKRTRVLGLYSSFFLMTAFTMYIHLILNYSDFIPCSCGGILEKMGWTEHLIFNIFFIILGGIAIVLSENSRQTTKSKILLRCFGCIVAALLLVTLLFLSSEHMIKKENNFTRRFLQHPVEQEKIFDLKFDSYYFAGYSKDKIYLGNYTAPEVFTSLDTAYRVQKSIKLLLNVPGQRFRSALVQVREPYFYIYDGSIPVIFRGFIGDSMAEKMSNNDVYFTQLQVTTPELFAFRTQSKRTKSNILGTFNPGSNKVNLNYELLKKQYDGVFDTDGKLLYDQKSHRLVYSYFYRNEFLVMDSSVKLLRSLHTIDTVTKAQVKVINLEGGRHKLTAPPLMVNKNMAVYNNILLVESNLKGKFESDKIWDNASVIDIYSINEQSYLGSFFIEHRGKIKLSQMLLTDKYLFILSGREMLRYRLAQAITKHFKTVEAEKP